NGQIAGTVSTRAWTYVSLAMYDATIAAWESKYFYNRPRPSATDPSIRPRLATPCSPSYPSDYAATAAAASEVLAYLLPNEAEALRGLAEEASRTRLSAGLEYPSDYSAGLDLGRRVAAQVIAKARGEGDDAVWNGTGRTGACMWVGTTPGGVTAPNWRTSVLTPPSEFRPPAPPSCTSPEIQAQLAQVRDFPRNIAAFTTN